MVGLYRVVICQYNDYNGKPDIYIINCFVSVIWQNLPSICSDGIPTVFLHYLSNAYRCPGNSGSIYTGHIRPFSSMNGHGKVGISFAILPRSRLDRYCPGDSWSGYCYKRWWNRQSRRNLLKLRRYKRKVCSVLHLRNFPGNLRRHNWLGLFLLFRCRGWSRVLVLILLRSCEIPVLRRLVLPERW